MILSNRFVWEIKKGDLVKLKDYPNAREDEFVYLNGIVVSEIKHTTEEQIPMWPSVDVYVFEKGYIRNCMPGSLEVISNS